MAKIIISAGKGGVGKTLVAVSLASFLSSRHEKVGLIDYDGGHSVKNTLGLKEAIPTNKIHEVNEHFSVVVIDNTKYLTIIESKEKEMTLNEYLDQFPADHGIIPFADMVSQFFGVPTDIPSLQKFATLVASVVALKEAGCATIVIDVEPTAGLERLLTNADSMIRSLRRLKDKGLVFLGILGATWPDIKGYLKSDYIKKIDGYTEHIKSTVDTIRQARFLLVCTPELGPANQTFEVKRIIEDFGGKAYGCVVNNIRGEEHEDFVIDQLQVHQLPLLKVLHKSGMHVHQNGKDEILFEIGQSLFEAFN